MRMVDELAIEGHETRPIEEEFLGERLQVSAAFIRSTSIRIDLTRSSLFLRR
jgi:hypothetical protein